MPFGLCNATATFQRLMAQALTRVTKKYGNLVMCYVDDVFIATPTLEDHIDRLDEIFGCMKKTGLKCKPSKCEILRDSIKCPGRMADRHGRSCVDAVEAVLTWKTYSMDQSYIGRWIVRLDGYHMIIEHRMRDKQQNADSFSKKTEFYERLEQKQANQAEIKEGFSILDRETYEALPLTRWLDKSGHPIPGHPELTVEKAAEIKILSKKDPVPLDLLLRSNLVQQELSRMNTNSLSLLDKTVQVAPQMMRMLGGLLEREVTRDDPEWAAAVTVSEKVKIMPSRLQHKENKRDCRTIVQQLVCLIAHQYQRF